VQGQRAHRWAGGVSCFLLLFLTILSVAPLYSQTDTSRVEATGKCWSTSVTPEEGWLRARRDAEANAIRKALGITVNATTFQATSEAMQGGKSADFLSLFTEINTTTTCGRIIAESILDSSLSTESNIPVYSVKIEATVAKDEGQPDPGFQVEIHLDKDVYYDRGDIDRNDAVHFSIKASQNCYLYIFDIMPNDSVLLLMPNAYFSDNSYTLSEGIEGFARKLAKLPFQMRVGLPQNKNIATEMIYVVALKKKIDFYSSYMTPESAGIIPTYQSAFVDLQKWLVRIPQSMRTSNFAVFTIKRAQ